MWHRRTSLCREVEQTGEAEHARRGNYSTNTNGRAMQDRSTAT
ncbi:MAG: hypothetical protein OJF58_003511 [Enhydrobacter sp.]|nr:MAG: hypothetical protein OJF58_003511 [Enhydrobacter sp.]